MHGGRSLPETIRVTGDFFEVFAWPGLIEAVHAEMWPR